MSQRRHSNKVNTFTYTDVHGNLSFVADGLIQGTDPPRSSEQVSISEMVEWLTPRLWVPGCRDHGFSAGWALLSAPTGAVRSQISLDGMTQEQVNEFARRADIAAGALGVPSGAPVPPELWDKYRQALLAIRKDVKGGR